MNNKQALPVFIWQIRIKDDISQPLKVTAAYHMNESAGFITFKNGEGKPVYTVARDAVLDIGRVSLPMPPHDSTCSIDKACAHIAINSEQ